MNKKKVLEAVKEIETEKGISKEILKDAVEESFRFAFCKKIEDEFRIDRRTGKQIKSKDAVKLPDALVRVDVDLDKAKIKIFHQWLVVREDDIKDDYIEMSIDEAKEKNPKIKLGDFYEEELSVDSMKDKDVGRFVSCFKQKINKAEKDALLAVFENKIGTIVTADVEKCDKFNVIVNLLGKTSATLYKDDLIGDEKFQVGDQIKVYVVGIGKDDKRGSLVKVSRSCPEFLAELFKNEIHEIYDGTVEIKKIARLPGRRSKVCVWSSDSNVDPSGSCIGQNGTRIQEIVQQLGNYTKDSKEKIDVITWSPNIGLFMAEIIKPAELVGMVEDKEKGHITAVVTDDTLPVAIGLKGINIRLASMLTGYEKVSIITESDANESGLQYKTFEEYQIEAKEEERKAFRERQEELRAKIAARGRRPQTNILVTTLEEEKPVEETPEVEETIEETTPIETPETVEVETKEPETVETVEPKTEEVKKPAKPEEHKDVVTTTTLEFLEKSLEEEKKEKKDKAGAKKKKKVEKKEEKEVKEEKKNVVKMDIYSEEELAEFENEEYEEDYDEEDYSDYDDDDYYDEGR